MSYDIETRNSDSLICNPSSWRLLIIRFRKFKKLQKEVELVRLRHGPAELGIKPCDISTHCLF